MITVKDISDYINKIAPYETSCSWDNPGLLIGQIDKQVKTVAFCLDLTEETLNNSINEKADLIITHHPAIFHAKKSFLSDDIVYKVALNGISLISAHTCFDCAANGVNDVLASLLGLSDVTGVESKELALPMARIGALSDSLSPVDFAKFVSSELKTRVSLVNCNRTIKKVAVCGGSGMDFIDDAIACGADVYVTGEASHHELLYAKQKNINLVIAGHFETEYPAMLSFSEMIKEQFPELACKFIEQSNPVEFY